MGACGLTAVLPLAELDPVLLSPLHQVEFDELRERFGLERIDFLKMDVEGYEHDVLRGAAGTIEQGLLGSIQFEFGSGNIKTKAFFKDIWELLSENFDFYRIAPGGVEHRIDSYYEDLEYYRGATNYVARCRSCLGSHSS